MLVYDGALKTELSRALAWAERLDVITCYTDARWFHQTFPRLTVWLGDDEAREVRILLGDDPKYQVGMDLLAWAGAFRDDQVRIHRSLRTPRQTLHAKLYLAIGHGAGRAWVGSNNLTHRGLIGPRYGNVEIATVVDDEDFDEAVEIFEREWDRSAPLGPGEPPPPPPQADFEDHLLGCFERGEFWEHELGLGKSVVSVPSEIFGVERASVRAGGLTLTRSGQARWRVFGSHTTRIRTHHNRARAREKEFTLRSPWGCLCTANGKSAWRDARDALERDFAVLVRQLLQTVGDREAAVKQLQDWALEIRRQEIGPKSRLSSKHRAELRKVAHDAIDRLESDPRTHPTLFLHRLPVEAERFRHDASSSAAGRTYRKALTCLLLDSLERTRELWLDGEAPDAIRVFQLVHDGRLEDYLRSNKQGQLFGSPVMSRKQARRRARRDLTAITKARTKGWTKLLSWATRFTQWSPESPIPG